MEAIAQFAQSTPAYSSSNDEQTLAGIVVLTFLLFFFGLIAIITYVVHAFLLGRVFEKAKVKQWIAWVPFYNTWKTLELGGQQGFWAILMIIPVVNIVASIFLFIAMYNIGLKLQKEGWFVLLAIFLPIVWLGWLAFDSSKWNEKGAATPTPKPTTAAK